MKKYLPIIFCFLLFGNVRSQVLFCPPGAIWHYVYNTNNMDPTPDFVNETAWNDGNAFVNGETVTVLKHSKVFTRYNTKYISSTYLKQIGDTVFMKSVITNDQWRILFNFAANPGQSWETKLSLSNIVFTVTVNAVSTTTINGFPLRIMNVTCEQSNPHRTYGAGITERLGGSYYLFNFLSGPVSDGDYLTDFLCYQDSMIGLVHYSSKPCDYSNLSGILELKDNPDIKLYPNPVSDRVTIESPLASPVIRLTNLLGQAMILDPLIADSKIHLDLAHLEKGIYVLQLFEKGKLVGSQKIIKE